MYILPAVNWYRRPVGCRCRLLHSLVRWRKRSSLARIVELKRQTHQEVLNRREIGEPLTVIEIPVDPGISIEFRQEICGLTQPQMIKLAQAFLEVIKSEKDKEAQEEKE